MTGRHQRARRKRHLPRAGTALLAVLAIALSVVPASPGQAASGRVSSRTLLGQLRTAPEHPRGFATAPRLRWADTDGDGCTAADEVLVRDARTPPTVGPGCVLTGGSWRALDDGAVHADPSSVAVDTVVPWAEAWRSGARRWSARDRRVFANDVGYRFALVVVTPAARRLRVGADARDWHPARQRDTCRYLARWVAVKHRWGLVVDPAERRFLARKLKSCGWPRVLRPGTTPVQVVRNAPGADRTSATLTIPCTVTGSETAAVVLRYAPAGTKRLYRRSASTAAQAGRTVTRVTLRGMRPAAGFDYRCTARTATAGLVLAPKSRRITTLAAPRPAPTTAPAPSPTPGPATTTPAPVPSETTPAGTTTPTPTPTTSTPPPASAPYKLVAVGDLCEGNNANSCDPTGQLASSMKPARVAILGDTQYENGTQTEFNNGYSQSSWNALNSISYPAIGNHEIASGTDAAYCGYFVHAHCPTPAERWYAYDIPSTRWRAIVLDSNYEDPTLGDRANDPAQLAFLKSELDTYKTTRNLLVYWHHPPWENGGAGSAGDQPRLVGFMNRIAAAHVDLVLWGHDHTYTRWARMGSQGPSASGVRAFTVGTGGAVRPRTTKSYPGTQAKSLLAGVLELTLRDADFSWRFVDTTNTVRDSGTMTVTP